MSRSQGPAHAGFNDAGISGAGVSLERMIARPAGRKCTTVAIYHSTATARGALVKLEDMGIDTNALSLAMPGAGCSGRATEEPADASGAQRSGSADLAPYRQSGLCDLGNQLVRLGVSADAALNYQNAVSNGSALLVVHSTFVEAGKAAQLLEKTHHSGLAEFDS